MACLVRVPIEVVKQRRQTHAGNKSSLRIALAAYKYEGIRKVQINKAIKVCLSIV